MAETLPADINKDEAVKWAPVRELADTISSLYASKQLFEFESLEKGALVYGISTENKSTRWSDIYANKCTNDSSQDGCVYLSADVTAPFRLDKLGQDSSNAKLEPRILAFEFAYNPDTYEEYLLNQKLPVLVTQYLIYYEAIENDKPGQENIALCTEHLEDDLCSVPAVNEFMVIGNLIESRRDQVKKFWDKGNPYSKSKEVSGELYMIIEDNNTADCNIIARIAWAGMNGNGNGNSPVNGKRPAEWLNGNVCGGYGRFVDVGQDPWMHWRNPKAITLTGVSWDRQPMSAPSRAGFKPETPQATGYSPPPIGCCAEYIWPSIGLEGGGEGHNFYNPSSLSGLITWADWRKEYQQPLTAEQVEKARRDTTDIEEIPDRHFPCYLAKEYTGGNENTYAHVTSIIQLDYRYQRWIKLSEDTYVRLAPMEFNATDGKKAYLTVPLTIAKIIQPKSYQTAIRKRWYDMLYYSLRNIAGYKLKTTNTTTNATVEKVIGVTWDNSKIDVEAYLNPCKHTNPTDEKPCTCDACKYERWKIFKLGGEGWENSNYKTAPFVGTVTTFDTYNNACSYNAAQMWQWNQDRYNTIVKNLETGSYDFFPELYFEKLICYDNTKKFNEKAGGFELTEKTDTMCGCTLCDEPLTLPWEGGGKNAICDGSGSYATHAYTFNKLKYLTKFIIDYKLPENAPRNIDKMEIGEAHSYANADTVPNATTSNQLTFTGGTKKVTGAIDSSGEYECISTPNTTYTLPLIPAYYQTLSDNEKSTVKVDSSIDVKTGKEEKSYGYNAYIWKAFDPGGYVEYQGSDIKIKFKQKTPAVACAAPTVVNVFADGIKKVSNDETSGSDDDPLYLYDTTEYQLDGGYRTAYPCCAWDAGFTLLQPGATKDMGVLQNNWNADTWEGLIQWCAEDPILFVQNMDTRDNYMDPINAGAVALWARDNEETAIGTIDIYLAPVSDGDAAHQYKAKYIGSCSFKVTTEGSSETGCVNFSPWSCVDKKPIDANFVVTAQTVTATPITGRAETSQLIEVNIIKQPSPEDSELEAEIIIASDILKDKDYTIANDQRQKYIILAARASHTHINSWLAYHEECDLQGQDTEETKYSKLKEWAMHYAGACRHAEFDTSYEFSREETPSE